MYTVYLYIVQDRSRILKRGSQLVCYVNYISDIINVEGGCRILKTGSPMGI